jgi:hypothetical protein
MHFEIKNHKNLLFDYNFMLFDHACLLNKTNCAKWFNPNYALENTAVV